MRVYLSGNEQRLVRAFGVKSPRRRFQRPAKRRSDESALIASSNELTLSAKDVKALDHRATSTSRKGQGASDSLAGGTRDRVGSVSLASAAVSSGARPVLNKNGRIKQFAHFCHINHVIGVDHRGVMESVLHFVGALNSFVDVFATDEGKERHHLLDRNERRPTRRRLFRGIRDLARRAARRPRRP